MQRVTKKNVKLAIPMLAAAAATVCLGVPKAHADIIASFSDGTLDGLSITGYASQATINGILYDDYIVQLLNNGANGTGSDLVGLSGTVDTASQNYSSSVGALYINTAKEGTPPTQPGANVFGNAAVANSIDPGNGNSDPLAGDEFGYPNAGTFIGLPDGTNVETNYADFQTKLAYINGNTNTQNGGSEGVGSNVIFKASKASSGTTPSSAAVPIDAAYLSGTVHSLETDTVINPQTDFTDASVGAQVANIVVPDGTTFTFSYSAGGSTGANQAPQHGSITNAIVVSTTSTGPTLSLGSPTNTVVGTVAVTGLGNGNYNPTVTTISPAATTGSVAVSGFNPSSDSEIFALEVLEGGSSPGADLTTIAAQLQTALDAEYPGATVTTTDPTPGGAFKGSSFFDIFADIPTPGAGGNTALNFGLTGFTGTSGGTITLAAVGVVPEPTGVGVLALGAIGLMARRRRIAKA